jgi:hypothetical protein
MTGQFPDTVDLDATTYAITAIDGPDLFQPGEYGLQPRMLSTACWRGFICSYAVRAGSLVLDTLEIGLGPDDPPVVLNGVTPEPGRPDDPHEHATYYRRLDLVVAFTGRLLLGAELDRYVHMGFQPAWHYLRVVELVLADGRVVQQADRSAELAEARRLMESEPSETDVSDWISNSFSRGYAYSWPHLKRP